MNRCVQELEEENASLVIEGYEITSPCTDEYNCLAFAAGDLTKWWEPTKLPPYHWPLEQYDYKLDSFRVAFEKIGFEATTSTELEDGIEKIAVFVDEEGDVSHAAFQEHDGAWKSKCGDRFDIRHTLGGLSNYGTVQLYMKRPRVNRNPEAYDESIKCRIHSIL